jgi:ribosomal protein L30E
LAKKTMTTVTKTIGGGTLTVTPKTQPYNEVKNTFAFAVIKSDGSVVTWGTSWAGGNQSVYDYQTNYPIYSVTNQLDGTIDVKQIFSSSEAFAALRVDGSVVTWGNPRNGGDSSSVAKQLDGTIDVKQIFSSSEAFAALRVDGSVVTWGGVDSSAVEQKLDGSIPVTQIFSNSDNAFTALRVDGSVVTWGDPSFGGDSSSVAKQLDGTIDVKQIFSNWGAFAALRVDGSVVTWGDISSGGDSSVYHYDYSNYSQKPIKDYSVTSQLDGTIDVTQIFFNGFEEFSALRMDGSVVTWGNAAFGGDSSGVANQLDGTIDVKQIFSNGWGAAFAALRVDGSVVTWGDISSGGDSSVYHYDIIKNKNVKDYSLTNQLDGSIDVTQIFSTGSAFAALRVDGSVVTWGDPSFGGDSSVSHYDSKGNLVKDYSVAKQLDGTIDVKQIFSNNGAFAALRVDGSVVTWGSIECGGDSSSVAKQLDGTIDVTQIFSSTPGGEGGSDAFAALRTDGSIITWGNPGNGGDSSAVAKQLDGTIDVIQILSNGGGGFTALRADGSVVKWGGDDSIQIPTQLNRGIVSFADPSTDDVYVSASSVNHAPTGSVKVSGTATQGKTLTVSNNLKDVDGIGEITYEWKTGDTILGIGTTYKLNQSDVGTLITVSANYTDKLGNTESVKSTVTKSVANINDLPTGSVVISGVAAKNRTLTATNTLVDEDGVGEITYQWKTGKTVLGTGETYTLKQSDIGKTINVTATYKDGYKKIESVSSKSTSPVIDVTDSSNSKDSLTIIPKTLPYNEIQNKQAYAVIKSDGSVVTWGRISAGGNSSVTRYDSSGKTVNDYSVTSQLDGTIDVTQIFSTGGAFAALRADGSVVTWGSSSSGGDSNVYHYDNATNKNVKDYSVASQLEGSIDVAQIFSTSSAFAALRADGSVVTWGDTYSGGNSSAVAKQLDGTIDVKQVCSIGSSLYGEGFAALRADGSVVTWGNTYSGGDSSAVAKQLDGTIDVKKIFSNGSSVAALRADGSVVTWGDTYSEGDSSAVAKQLDGSIDVTQIFSNEFSFAALRADGSVVTWGNASYGGDSSVYTNNVKSYSVANLLNGSIDVIQIFSNGSAFAALRVDGSVVTWGDTSYGGDSSIYNPYDDIEDYSVLDKLNGSIDIKQIFSNGFSFAALRVDGSVVTWGSSSAGGDSNAEAKQLDGTIDVTQIYPMFVGMHGNYGFSALRADGSVVTWGWGLESSADNSSLTKQLDGSIDVTKILPTGNSFAALRADGSIVTVDDQVWWNPDEYIKMPSQLTGVVSFTDASTDDIYKVSDVTHSTTTTSGDDVITGTSGRNTINGGLGKDTLTGGLGSDTFVFNTTLNAQTNVDTITDFVSDVDQIQLAKSIMTKIGNVGDLNASAFTLSNQPLTAAANRIIYDPSSGSLSYDADGSGSIPAIQFAIIGVYTHPILSNTDFVIV